MKTLISDLKSPPRAITSQHTFSFEQRWWTIGLVGTQVLMVVHTWPDFDVETGEEVGRIIFAHKATRHEREAYEEGHE